MQHAAVVAQATMTLGWAQELTLHAPWLAAMGVLVLFSGMFSASEAALFYLSPQDRRAMAGGSRPRRIALDLLDQPDRLLTAVLFCNLVVNIAYFALASIVSIRLSEKGSEALAIGFSVGALLTIIFFSELLPKSLAVLQPRTVAGLVAVPLAAVVRAVDPLIPAFRMANLLSRRLLWPTFTPEPHLDVADLERAVELSTTDAALLAQEQVALQNVVSLSYIRADELMRPRTRFRLFRPPLSIQDLQGEIPPGGYAIVAEPHSDEVAGAVPLRYLPEVPKQHLEHYAEDVLYVPWCASVATVLDQLRARELRVAAVVNEFGETIGILTIDDVLDTIFRDAPSELHREILRGPSAEGRGPGLHDHAPIQQVADDEWHVIGMTNLRRLAKYFQIELPPTHNVTVAGAVQEMLEHLPQPGDRCRWGPFEVEVLDVPERGQLLVRLTRAETPEEPS